MRSLEESRKRWQVTIQHASSLEALKKSVRSNGDGSPCKAGLRSTFLLFQNTEITGWSRTLVDSRSAYASLREHLLRYIENPDEVGSSLDPLDDDRHSPWNTLRQDEEIRAEIFQDVERCMPEEPFFRQSDTQRLMLDILFVFCKINQDIGYRQGMHEILAPILWVIEQDAIDYGNAVDQPSTNGSADELIKQTLDSAYIEHDAFTILSLIMRTAKSFYELGEPDRRSGSPSRAGAPLSVTSPIVERSMRIHEVYLARLDPALAKHFTDVEVLPQIFLIRWIRLLFGREFPFDDLLALWDILLAEDPGLDLVDMVCVAMLLRIRWRLIDANYSVALMLLLKYPSPPHPHGPQTFVDDAIYLRDNFSAAGGSEIIRRYSGKAPPHALSFSRPSTPLDASGSRQKLSGTRSPLSSPARFIQQQGGMEALFHGAAKGVFDRGEKLGINQAVRDAVGEVKRNMHGLQASRPNSAGRRTSDVMQWSLDDDRSDPSAQSSIDALIKRNEQLAQMLDQAMKDLRSASASKDNSKEDCVKAMDLAHAKVEFVKVYLEDSTMPLPKELDDAPLSASLASTSGPQAMPGKHSKFQLDSETPSLVLDTARPAIPTSDATLPPQSASTLSSPVKVTRGTSSPESISTRDEESEPKTLVSPPARPTAPVPTRSTIANSSFSWMLEPDDSSSSGQTSTPQKSTSPFLKPGKKTVSGPSREKAAFLFGEEGGEPDMMGVRPPLLADGQEGFKLGTIRSKDK